MLAIAHRPGIRLCLPLCAVALGLIFLAMALRVRAEDPPASRAEAEKHLRTAEKAAQRRDFARAREELAKCLKLGLDNADVRLLAARTARRAGDYREAAKQLEACQRLKGAEKAIALEKLLVRAQRGEWTEVETALLLLADLKKDQPESVLILEALARCYLESFCLGEALTCLNGWLERRPDDVLALLWLAWVYDHHFVPSEQWHNGSRTYEYPDFQAYPPRDLEGRSRAASGHSTYSRRPLGSKSLDTYLQIMKLDPQNDVARLRLAEGLLAASRANDALKHFQHLHKRLPRNAAVRLGLARCRIQLGDEKEARKLLDDLLTEDARSVAALVEKGRLVMQGDKPAEAEKLLRQAVTQAPSDYEANYLLSTCLIRMGKESEAEKARVRMERIAEDMKRYEVIVAKINAAPRDAAPRYDAGIFLIRHDHGGEGARWLQTALRMDPRHRPSHQALADYYERSGQKEQAEKHRQQAR